MRPPAADDAPAIFERYASDPGVVRYLSFPRHTGLDQTRAFLEWSRSQWEEWPAGPYLIFAREGSKLLGGTGLRFETAARAEVGYVLARDAWGQGLATEALAAMVGLARDCGVRRLHAFCHPDHTPSHRVLAKCGFMAEATLRHWAEFPNLAPGVLFDVVVFSRFFEDASAQPGSGDRLQSSS